MKRSSKKKNWIKEKASPKNTIKNNVIIALSAVIAYGLQFIILPLFSNFDTNTNESAIFILASLTIWCIGLHFGHKCSFCMWIGYELIYFILVMMYNGRGLYGIGVTSVSGDGTVNYDSDYAILMVALLLVYMLLIKLVLIILSFMVKKIKQIFKLESR